MITLYEKAKKRQKILLKNMQNSKNLKRILIEIQMLKSKKKRRIDLKMKNLK
jgi:hypothetical protein